MRGIDNMPMTKEELIQYYEEHLEKVKAAYRTDTPSTPRNESNAEYIEQAEKDLEAVKNGRQW
ncbi:hypothetical protein CN918_29185 [Priestia megaterium]|nr:hypothetical protein CN918_29185 [Priestia megaterium]